MPSSPHPRTPVLVGGGQSTDRDGDAESGRTPLQLLAAAAKEALADTGAVEAAVAGAVDAVATVRLVMDTPNQGRTRPSQYANFPGALADRLGAPADAGLLMSDGGGNGPQKLVNTLAERIAAGERDCCLIGGVEALQTMTRRRAAGMEPKWPDYGEGAGRPAVEDAGTPADGGTPRETMHGTNVPVNAYPLFANALRGLHGQSVDEHRQACGELFAGFNRVAAANPHAWFAAPRTAEEIATPSDANRVVGLPYTKYMNAVIRVNQAAAVLLCSYAKARELGIEPERMVFLHGCADMNEVWNLSQRRDFHSSPAIRACARIALEASGIEAADLEALDIYSCFPSAVQVACAEIGIAPDGDRPLTLTGGLPYFGGPGNNYSTHGLVEMLRALRGGGPRWGLATSNGWYLTKHAIGVYSPQPPQQPWTRPDCSRAQAEIDAAALPLREDPEPGAAAEVETYTLAYGRDGPQRGILMARLRDGGRVVANVDADSGDAGPGELLREMAESEYLGRRGSLHPSGDGRTLFRPD